MRLGPLITSSEASPVPSSKVSLNQASWLRGCAAPRPSLGKPYLPTPALPSAGLELGFQLPSFVLEEAVLVGKRQGKWGGRGREANRGCTKVGEGRGADAAPSPWGHAPLGGSPLRSRPLQPPWQGEEGSSGQPPPA